MIEIKIRMAGDQRELEQRSLYNWLRDDRELRRNADVRAFPVESEPDTMGIDFEAIQLIIGSALQMGSLAVAIAMWRRAHSPRATMIIERNGVKVILANGVPDDAETILRALEGRLEEDLEDGDR